MADKQIVQLDARTVATNDLMEIQAVGGGPGSSGKSAISDILALAITAGGDGEVPFFASGALISTPDFAYDAGSKTLTLAGGATVDGGADGLTLSCTATSLTLDPSGALFASIANAAFNVNAGAFDIGSANTDVAGDDISVTITAASGVSARGNVIVGPLETPEDGIVRMYSGSGADIGGPTTPFRTGYFGTSVVIGGSTFQDGALTSTGNWIVGSGADGQIALQAQSSSGGGFTAASYTAYGSNGLHEWDSSADGMTFKSMTFDSNGVLTITGGSVVIGDTPFTFSEPSAGTLNLGDGGFQYIPAGPYIQIFGASNGHAGAVSLGGLTTGGNSINALIATVDDETASILGIACDAGLSSPGTLYVVKGGKLFFDTAGFGYVPPALAGMATDGNMDAATYSVAGTPGLATFSGAVTNITVVNGIVTAAS